MCSVAPHEGIRHDEDPKDGDHLDCGGYERNYTEVSHARDHGMARMEHDARLLVEEDQPLRQVLAQAHGVDYDGEDHTQQSPEERDKDLAPSRTPTPMPLQRLLGLSLDPPTPEFLAAWSACGAGLNRVVGVLEHDPEVWRPV